MENISGSIDIIYITERRATMVLQNVENFKFLATIP
jgi:hypothetical protein